MNEETLNQKIEFVKGVGPHKASLLNKEVGIYTLYDMLHYFPFRYEDRSEIKKLSNITEDETDGVYLVQVLKKTKTKKFKNKTLKVKVKDNSGYAELIWVQGFEGIDEKIVIGKKYLIFGKPKIFKNIISFFHPETNEQNTTTLGIKPVYSTTERLKKSYINNRFFNKIIDVVVKKTLPFIEENLSQNVIEKAGLISRASAYQNIHLPKYKSMVFSSVKRLKFE